MLIAGNINILFRICDQIWEKIPAFEKGQLSICDIKLMIEAGGWRGAEINRRVGSKGILFERREGHERHEK